MAWSNMHKALNHILWMSSKENVNILIPLTLICDPVISISTTHTLSATFALTIWICLRWNSHCIIIYPTSWFLKIRIHWLEYTLYWQWISQIRRSYTHFAQANLLACSSNTDSTLAVIRNPKWTGKSVEITLITLLQLKCNFNALKSQFTLLELCKDSIIVDKSNI